MAFLETVGFEIEGSGIDRDRVVAILAEKLAIRESVNVTRDASVEQKFKYISPTIAVSNNDYLANKTYYEYGGELTLGYEITTPAGGVEFKTAEGITRSIVNSLVSRGEMTSPRSSLHIHVGYASSFNLLRSAFAIGLWIEPLMYKLGGMGGKFRGYINNSIYCRPLELSVAVPSEVGGFYNLLTYDSVFDSEDTKDFWLRYGININSFQGNPNRYHPARYFGFNLLSIPIHGTIEFRYFNSCLNTDYILAMIRFCQAITEFSTKVPRVWVTRLENTLRSNVRKSIIEPFSSSEYHKMLDEIEYNLDKYELSYNTTRQHRQTIRDIIEKSETPVFSEKLPKTHIKQYLLPAEMTGNEMHPKVTNPIESGYIDIHNVQRNYHSIIEGGE